MKFKVRIGPFNIGTDGFNSIIRFTSLTTIESMPTTGTNSKRYGKLKEERALLWAKVMVVAGASTIVIAGIGIVIATSLAL